MGATDMPPAVGGTASSLDVPVEEWLLRAIEGSESLALWDVEKDGSL